MKLVSGLLVCAAMVMSALVAEAQVTNLQVNGSGSSFTFTSGDAVSWSYNIPTGTTAIGELWYDVNQNGVIDPLTDVQRFVFTQTDGDTLGNGGPPDIDGTANGAVVFSEPVGLAPGKYILKMTQNSVGGMVAGTVTALASPAHLISGHVTPPSGKSAQYINVQVHRNDQYGQPNFWDGYTDASGNYTIQMNADTAGNPWNVRMETNPYPPSIISPDGIDITITGNHSGNDFTFLQAAAQVDGVIRDENGDPVSGFGVSLWRSDGGVQHHTNTNPSGEFQLGLQAGELSGDTWNLQTDCNCGNGETQNILTAYTSLPAIALNDSLYRTLTVYYVNSQIQGQVRLNGSPLTYSMPIMATVADTAYSQTWTDSTTGNFTFSVSDKLYDYELGFQGLPYGWEVQQTIAHPGDSGVILNIATQSSQLINWADSWNMLSVPLKVNDNQVSTLFPAAVSPAFSYSGAGGYQQQTNLFNGIGYWMKFNGSNVTSMNGTFLSRETLYVQTGWNLIGGPSCPIAANSVIAVGTTLASPFFGYTIAYFAAATLQPGYAYWVKCSGPGQLILDCGSKASPSNTPTREYTGEYPPAPPADIAAPLASTPLSSALDGNFPNPFNPTTEIRYEIASQRFVSLKIYDIMGREVASLVHQEQPPGYYTARWDASTFPSGVYYYRLVAGEYSAVKKLVLLR